MRETAGSRRRSRPDGENFGGEVSLASSSLIVVCTRVNGRGATRAWIDRTNDGLSGCPPMASSCRQKGTSARPAGAARRLGYINGATGRNASWPHIALLGPRELSDLSPQSWVKRTLIRSLSKCCTCAALL